LKSTFILAVLILAAGHLCGQQQIVFLQINKNDSLARALEGKKFISNEQKYHQMIWRLKAIRQQAINLHKKGAVAFTMTDDWPSPESGYFIISFYEMMMDNKIMDRYSRLQTYRINRRMKIERYNVEEDSWSLLTE
jgi:hypothetical protein